MKLLLKLVCLATMLLISSYSSLAQAQTVSWQSLGRGAYAVAANPNSGSVAGIFGGHVYRWNGGSWTYIGCCAIELAIDSTGNPWIINYSGNILRWTGGQWRTLPGRAKDISIGGGTVWIIGYGSGNRDLYYWDWNSETWTAYFPEAGVRVDASSGGTPYVVNSSNDIFRISGQFTYTQFPGKASDIAVGNGDQDLYVLGINHGSNKEIFKWNIYTNRFQKLSGKGTDIDVIGGYDIFLTNSSAEIFYGVVSP